MVTMPSWGVHTQPVTSSFPLLFPFPPLLTLGGNGSTAKVHFQVQQECLSPLRPPLMQYGLSGQHPLHRVDSSL